MEKDNSEITEQVEVSESPEVILRSIQEDSMPMELSVLEYPLFQFSYVTKNLLETFKTEVPITKEEMDTQMVTLNQMSEQDREETIELLGYKFVEKEDGSYVKQMFVETSHLELDGKGNKKGMLFAKAIGRLPRSFEADVFFALFRMFIKKCGGFKQNPVTKKYDIKTRKLYFTFYELERFMKLKHTGTLPRDFRNSIRLLYNTSYTSVGLFYDANKEKYISDGERPIRLIEDYEFNTAKGEKLEKSVKQITLFEGDNINKKSSMPVLEQLNMVRFSELIIENIENEYFKYLNPDIYFSLPSGLTRKLYGHLERNRYDNNRKELPFIKRKYETLRKKIPIDYKHLSRGKDKIANACKYLIKEGFIRDFIFCDEVKIAGRYDDAVIFCIKHSKEDTIKLIESTAEIREQKKVAKDKADLEAVITEASEDNEKPYLKMPKKDLIQELLDRGVARYRIKTICSGKNDWDIIKMIIFVDKMVHEGKINKSTGAMLASAIENSDDYKEIDQDITEFIEIEKIKKETAARDLMINAKELYSQYIINEIERYKVEEPIVYNLAYSSIVGGLKDSYEKNKNGEIKLAEPIVAQLEDFINNGEDNEWFREYFKKEFAVIVKLSDMNAFCNKLYYDLKEKEKEGSV
jgi:hypothetical protein